MFVFLDQQGLNLPFAFNLLDIYLLFEVVVKLSQFGNLFVISGDDLLLFDLLPLHDTAAFGQLLIESFDPLLERVYSAEFELQVELTGNLVIVFRGGYIPLQEAQYLISLNQKLVLPLTLLQHFEQIPDEQNEPLFLVQ